VWAAFVLGACQTLPDLAHPQVYEKDGISFRLPANWEVSDDVAQPDKRLARYIIVEAASAGSIIGIQIYRPPLEMTLLEYAGNHRARMLENSLVKLLDGQSTQDVRPISGGLGGVMRDGVVYNVNLSLLGQDVPHTVRFSRVDVTGATAYLVMQVPDEDWAGDRPGFELFSESFSMK